MWGFFFGLLGVLVVAAATHNILKGLLVCCFGKEEVERPLATLKDDRRQRVRHELCSIVVTVGLGLL
jgi:hypothetical protein